MSNVFSFTGTCGADAVVRYTASGMAVLSVNVANNVGFGDKQQTLWVRVTVFGKRAEGNLKDYLKKSQQIFVSGELTQNTYQANDGTTKTSLELNATIVDLVGKKSESTGAGQYAPTPHEQAKANAHQSPRPPQGAPPRDNFDKPYDQDIPF